MSLKNPVLRLMVLGSMAAFALAVFGGCASWHGKRRSQGTSVMQFLYPKEIPFVTEERIPELRLPLRVGVAFVPSPSGRDHAAMTPSEQQRSALVETVAERFRSLPYIAKVEHIPSAYLRPEGGFANLDQIGAMFGIDVIALVAYD